MARIWNFLARLIRWTLATCCMTLSSGAQSQAPSTYDQLLVQLHEIAELDQVQAEQAVEVLWAALTTSARIPYCEGDRVVFLFRQDPEAVPSSVAWLGDFNGWSPAPEDMGRPLGRSGLWYLEKRFPSDARMDYKLFLNGKQWLLDPANPHHQVGGYGPNNVLAMPDYQSDPLVQDQPHVAKGTLESGQVHANLLGYEVTYTLYRPVAAETLGALPSLYVMDGHEYADPQMGAMVQVLDNLIAQGRVPPLYVIFVDPRDPKRGDNRRIQEYGHGYGLYSRFLCDELVPLIDEKLPTLRDPLHRGIMGTSLGGLFSAYTLIAHADQFQLAGIHSPAFGFDARHARVEDRLSGPVLELWRKAPQLGGRAYVLAGTLADVEDVATPFVDMLKAHGVAVDYRIVHDGHSWGNWRDHIDDTLLHLFAPN